MPVATWVGHPRSYTARRDHSIQYIVVHYTAGSEGPTSAENGAAYDKSRTDGTSTHVFADSNSVVREVWDDEVAHAAFYRGNHAGLQLEICGTAQTRAQWLDPVSSATLRMAAKQCAEWCAEHGIPVRRLSVAETRAAWYNAAGSRPKGFVGHVDVTQAYPEDGGNHTDPGPQFPWDVFLAMVTEELGDDMTPEEHNNLVATDGRVWHSLILGADEYPDLSQGAVRPWIVTAVKDLQAKVDKLSTPTIDYAKLAEEIVKRMPAPLTDKQTEDAAFRGAQRAEAQ